MKKRAFRLDYTATYRGTAYVHATTAREARERTREFVKGTMHGNPTVSVRKAKSNRKRSTDTVPYVDDIPL